MNRCPHRQRMFNQAANIRNHPTHTLVTGGQLVAWKLRDSQGTRRSWFG